MGLRHGALQLLEQLRANEAAALQALDIAADRIRYNPEYALAQIRKAQDTIRAAALLRDDKLPTWIQKAAPALETEVDNLRKTVDDLAERLARLERGAAIRLETR